MRKTRPKDTFTCCPECTKWVCDNDWNDQAGLCVECPPHVNVKIAAARAKRMTEEIEEQASQTKVFSGSIEAKQTLCPKCQKPAGVGKFCTNCGASLALNQ